MYIFIVYKLRDIPVNYSGDARKGMIKPVHMRLAHLQHSTASNLTICEVLTYKCTLKLE